MLYRRNRIQGGCNFFTVTLRDRRSSLLADHIDLLRASVRQTLHVTRFPRSHAPRGNADCPR